MLVAYNSCYSKFMQKSNQLSVLVRRDDHSRRVGAGRAALEDALAPEGRDSILLTTTIMHDTTGSDLTVNDHTVMSNAFPADLDAALTQNDMTQAHAGGSTR